MARCQVGRMLPGIPWSSLVGYVWDDKRKWYIGVYLASNRPLTMQVAEDVQLRDREFGRLWRQRKWTATDAEQRVVARWTTHVLVCLEGHPCEGRPAFIRDRVHTDRNVTFRGLPLPLDQDPCSDNEPVR